ncbi:MAG: HAMP domain-containing histidine kinase [Melioribacteraceae bacterium]|nr:HAMP domain-containing histidine kinase [Melioribacteraceae bacterium]
MKQNNASLNESRMCLVSDQEGSIIFINEKFREMLSDYFNVFTVKNLNQIKQKENSEIIDLLKKKIDYSIAQKKTTDFEFTLKLEDNISQRFYFEFHPLQNSDYQKSAVLIQGYSESLSQETVDETTDIFNEGFNIIFKCNEELKILSCSSNYGCKIGKNDNLNKFLPENLVESILIKQDEIKTDNLINQFEFNIFHKNRQLLVEVNMFNVKDGFYLILRDRSLQKEKDKELRKYLEELHYNKIISEQYAKELSLVNKKLNESQEELSQLNLNKDRFFSIIAHDLRSPFSSLLGFSEYLNHEAENLSTDEVKEYSTMIYRTGKHILSLLENLLQWSRVQLGRIDFSPSEYNITEQLLSIKNYFDTISRQKDISIICNEKDEIKVFADQNMIETVIRNLISNSIKFTHSGGSIELSAEKKKSHVEVTIKDSGVGMPEDVVQNLFKIESQHTTRGTNNEKGSGLGLIICNEFVKKNNGTIKVNSKINSGTSFIVSIPVSKNTDTKEETKQFSKIQKTTGYRFSK